MIQDSLILVMMMSGPSKRLLERGGEFSGFVRRIHYCRARNPQTNGCWSSGGTV